MTDKVQKIREEVERLKSQLLRGACSSQIAMETMCKEEAYNEVLAILDSLQEEPKKCMFTKDSYTDEDRKVLCDDCEEECKYAQKEEPVSDECIYNRTLEEKQRSCKFCSAACQVRIKEEPVSEELDNAAFDYAEACKYEGGEKLLCVEHFKAGAKWKEKQMVAKAVDGDITFDYYGDGDKTYGCIAHDSFCLEDFGLKDRDKVKVVVIKVD